MGVNVDNLIKSFLKAGKIPDVPKGQGVRPLEKVAENLSKFVEENKGQAFLGESSAKRLKDSGMPLEEVTPDYILIPGAQNGEQYILPYFTQYNKMSHEDIGFYRMFDSSFNTKKPDTVPYVFDDIKNIVPAHGKLVDDKIVITKRGSIDFGDNKPIINQNSNGMPEELELVKNIDDITGSSFNRREISFDVEEIPPVAGSHEFTRQQIQYMNEKTARSYLTSSESTFGGKSADDYLVNRVRQQFNKQVTYLRENSNGLSDDDISKLYTKNLLTAKQLLEKGATFQDYFFGNKVPYILGGAVAAIGIMKIASNVNKDN